MTFNPTFIRVKTVDECADLINRPHEDYPQRVNVTAAIIRYHIEVDTDFVTTEGYKAMHSYIMYDMDVGSRGVWRTCHVTVGDATPCSPYLIQAEIERNQLQTLWFNKLVDDSDIIRWYRALMIVHPFKDGNGRVGGCIAAIASHYLSKGEYLLAPCQ